MPKLPNPIENFPRPPRLSEILKRINPVKEVIEDARAIIKSGREEISSIASALRVEGKPPLESTSEEATSNRVAEAAAEPTPLPKPPEIALEAHSLDYQLDTLLDDLQHLETEHLPAQGRLQGLPCDCIAKAARDLRRHARETIPIAARESKEATIFSEMAAEGDRLIEIGTVEAVRSGLYDAEYLKHAGTISNYRKAVERMRQELSPKSQEPCPECETLKELSRYMKYQRKQREKPEGSKQPS